MKILVFNWRDITHPSAGGAEVYIHEVAKRWVDWGHEVTLLCGKYERCKDCNEIDGIEVIRRGGPYTVYLQAMREYLLNLRNRNYHVIIDSINGVPFFTPLYVREPKVAIVYHLVKNIFFVELPWHKAIVGYTAEKTIPLVYRNIPFITISESTKKDLINFKIPEENVTIIRIGMNHKLYKPNVSGKSPYPHVVYVGRIKQYKNVDHLIEAMKMVVNEFEKRSEPMSGSPDSVKLTIAGKGGYGELRALANKLGLSKHQEFLGQISETEKVRLLQGAWVYVTASRREGWGIAAMEANACGTPAIAYDVLGIRDSVMNGETGFLVPYGNIKKLAELIIKILTNDGLRKRLSENAHKWSMNFNWDKAANKLMKVIKDSC